MTFILISWVATKKNGIFFYSDDGGVYLCVFQGLFRFFFEMIIPSERFLLSRVVVFFSLSLFHSLFVLLSLGRLYIWAFSC